MDAIFGSKLYKTSSRKAEITAALTDPINAELVKQLRKYLDPEYLKPEYLGEEPKELKVAEQDSEIAVDTSSPEPKPRLNLSPSSTPSLPDESGETSEGESSEGESSDAEIPDTEEPDTEGDVIFDESESGEVEESVSTDHLTDIVACQEIDSDVIKGTLNFREDCNGVARVAVKNDAELWIYYKDSINLNSVMEAVIAFLSVSGYSQLMFSRLARTDNAIVFDIIH